MRALLVVLLVLAASTGFAATDAFDRANELAYFDGFQDGDDGGSGWDGGWVFLGSGDSAGLTLDTSTNNGDGDTDGDGDIDTANVAWEIFAQGGDSARVSRHFVGELAIGQVFSVNLDAVAHPDPYAAGVELTDGFAACVDFRWNGDDEQFEVVDAGGFFRLPAPDHRRGHSRGVRADRRGQLHASRQSARRDRRPPRRPARRDVLSGRGDLLRRIRRGSEPAPALLQSDPSAGARLGRGGRRNTGGAHRLRCEEGNLLESDPARRDRARRPGDRRRPVSLLAALAAAAARAARPGRDARRRHGDRARDEPQRAASHRRGGRDDRERRRRARRRRALGGYVRDAGPRRHARALSAATLAGQSELFAFLLLAHGVTTVRDAGDAEGNATEPVRKGIASGAFPGPRIQACGFFVDGEPSVWKNTILARNPEEGRRAVALVVDSGYDCVKAYTELDAPTLAAIRDEPPTPRGVPVIGHVPRRVPYEEARLDDAQHLIGIPPPPADPSAALPEAARAVGAARRRAPRAADRREQAARHREHPDAGHGRAPDAHARLRADEVRTRRADAARVLSRRRLESAGRDSRPPGSSTPTASRWWIARSP
jgi:hypothetical protein